MTDTKQALEVVERLKAIGSYFSNRDNPCDQAASLLSSLAEENERLNAALRYEENRAGRIGTHGPGCESWGPAHYECAMRENASLLRALETRDAYLVDHGLWEMFTDSLPNEPNDSLTAHPTQPKGEGHE